MSICNTDIVYTFVIHSFFISFQFTIRISYSGKDIIIKFIIRICSMRMSFGHNFIKFTWHIRKDRTMIFPHSSFTIRISLALFFVPYFINNRSKFSISPYRLSVIKHTKIISSFIHGFKEIPRCFSIHILFKNWIT